MSKSLDWSMQPIEEPEIHAEIEFFIDKYGRLELINLIIKNIDSYSTSYDPDTILELIEPQDLIDDHYIKGIPGEEGMLLFINDNYNDERSVKISKKDFLYALNKKKKELENKAK